MNSGKLAQPATQSQLMEMEIRTFKLAALLGQKAAESGWKIVTAESCTGGLIARALTEIGGSSQWFERGFVTYSNEAKQESLGVAQQSLLRHGAVSETVAREMAQGALAPQPGAAGDFCHGCSRP